MTYSLKQTDRDQHQSRGFSYAEHEELFVPKSVAWFTLQQAFGLQRLWSVLSTNRKG